MTQQRANVTRGRLIAGAATEFATHSYTAASINRILETMECTKGALYFHFPSKLKLADAVLSEAETIYADIAHRWRTAQVDPLDAIAGLVEHLAEAFTAEPALRAEARLTLEPDLAPRRPSAVWEPTIHELAEKAIESGCIRRDFTAEKFVRTLAASLTGQRYITHIMTAAGDTGTIRARYTESLELVVAAAAATDQRRTGNRRELSSSDRVAV